MNMRISGLLSGCAAALLFSSPGAGAADAVVMADEAMVEYVRVCDAFGAGYFYIPGTETCLKISGFVRMDTKFSADDDSYGTNVRGRVNFNAKGDSEMGVLHAHVRVQGDGGQTEDAAAKIDQAYAEVGGLVFGYTENTWTSSKNGGASGFGSHSDGGLKYGYGQATQVGYNFTADNVFAALSLNNDNDATSFIPDVTGRLGGTLAGATVYGAAGYDQSAETFGVKLGLNAPIGEAGSAIVQGFYASGPTSYGANATPTGITGDTTHTPQWSVLASYKHMLASNLSANVGGQYSRGYYATALDGNDKLGNAASGINSWALEGSLVWNPVPNFEVRGEVVHMNFSDGTGYDGGKDTSGFLRLQRNF